MTKLHLPFIDMCLIAALIRPRTGSGKAVEDRGIWLWAQIIIQTIIYVAIMVLGSNLLSLHGRCAVQTLKGSLSGG